MSYQVLARKWRPKTFAQVVGQEHVVRALTNALEQQRLHHAYLFTGTRGVGKTTLARIIAKALNCETGITSTPCGVCAACTEIDKGRFVDLLEVDAASNTQVDAMRDLLDNAQYAPTAGRFKVYIIDEVHMLSRSAFNAMLKTLEEPPAHVKFILATTDPQKVPVTVLSRCLQFNLKQMVPSNIAMHLTAVLQEENISADNTALNLIARAAEGSMRDALSLLDQAIAYGAGSVNEAEVRAMLGAIDQDYLFNLLEALVASDGAALLKQAEIMEERSLSFEAALQDLAGLLHQIALAQTMPEVITSDLPERDRLLGLAQKISAEDIQLYYQIATLGRRDLSLAPDEFAGFNMSLLRMLAFAPSNTAAVSHTVQNVAPVSKPMMATPAAASSVAIAPVTVSPFSGDWRSFSDSLKPGFCKNLAQNCALITHDENSISLQVPQIHKHLLQYQDVLKTALKERFGASLKVNLEAAADDAIATPAAQISEEKATRQASAEESLQGDKFVQDMKEIFKATVIPSSIKPIQ
ncbi:MAG: DNA polymerase III subunit gamma/tau [Methylophilaceae bacterium]